MIIESNRKFNNRKEIGDILGGDLQKGIVIGNNVILLFTNSSELYSDYFYPKDTYENCMYTGIGRCGNQDSIENNMYNLNIEVMSHQKTGKHLLMFEKIGKDYYFRGEYKLTETHQNVQPDDNDEMRRVFVFHLEQVSEEFEY